MPKRKFTREFKESAAKLVIQQGYTVAEAAKSLGVDPNSIRAWVKKFPGDGTASPGADSGLRAELCCQALEHALHERNPTDELLHHSDRGVQYACDEYQQLLADGGLDCSISRKGNCDDNAVMESFFGTLKTELIHHETYHSRADAHQALFEYIEVFYNRKRRHSALGYRSLTEYEANLN